MNDLNELQRTIETRLAEIGEQVELVALERPGHDALRLLIDRPSGVDLELCERVTNQLRDLLADYALEVSSPGADRPLTKPEHYSRFIGRKVKVRTQQAVAGRRSFTGTLTEADERSVSVEADGDAVRIPLAGIRRSNLIPEFGGNRP